MASKQNKSIIASSLIAVALCLQPVAAWASDAGAAALKPETATADTRTADTRTADTKTTTQSSGPATAPSAQQQSTQPTMLYGSARKHDQLLDAGAAANSAQSAPQELNATANDAQLQAEKAAADAYAVAAQKLTAGMKLSAQEYRALGIGCSGIESYRTLFTRIAKITAVYPGSPADLAGIRIGDQEVSYDSDDAARANPTQPLWAVKFGRAGTPQNVTMLKDGQPVKITLIRMNIEDIQDPKIRRKWEEIVSRLGTEGGTFVGPSLHNLSQTK